MKNKSTHVMHAKSHLTNDRYQSSYVWNNNKQEDQRCSNVLTFCRKVAGRVV
ncbi:hypothetical protein WN48_03364 [Eufriesea mexicana]|uniref:Uncharacterized protein n=1 Tax=Eufriesea mexicana TaxID=516756 RepID=A0A310SKH9_9HYME|nr:hypothetical protein WN48_03364 [Eufriesea mexicana]